MDVPDPGIQDVTGDAIKVPEHSCAVAEEGKYGATVGAEAGRDARRDRGRRTHVDVLLVHTGVVSFF